MTREKTNRHLLMRENWPKVKQKSPNLQVCKGFEAAGIQVYTVQCVLQLSKKKELVPDKEKWTQWQWHVRRSEGVTFNPKNRPTVMHEEGSLIYRKPGINDWLNQISVFCEVVCAFHPVHRRNKRVVGTFYGNFLDQCDAPFMIFTSLCKLSNVTIYTTNSLRRKPNTTYWQSHSNN